MSVLVDQIREEISTREQQCNVLEQELHRLHEMEKLAKSLNGNGASASAPAPVEPSRGRAKKSGGRGPLSPGRNGGNAPGGRRPRPAGRKPGSAPSGKPAPARAPSSNLSADVRQKILDQVVAGGAEGAQLKDIFQGAFVQQTTASRYLRQLIEEGQVVRRGQSRASRYFIAPGRTDESTGPQTPPQPSHDAPPADEIDQAYLERRLIAELQKGPKTAGDAADAIDAPYAQVLEACQRLSARGGQVSRLDDGTYVA